MIVVWELLRLIGWLFTLAVVEPLLARDRRRAYRRQLERDALMPEPIVRQK